jgi:hypothetical protein
MPHGWTAAGRRFATRALVALVVAGGCLGAVAYAAQQKAGSGDPGPGGPRPSRPLIVRHPAKVSTASTAGFAFKVAHGTPRFQCRLDGGGWKGCRAPYVVRGVGPGDHSFAVRALSRSGRHGAAARFAWKRVEPKPFSIEPQLSSLGALYPGAAPQVIPLLLRNPNPVPIFVTALRVSVSADPPGCDGVMNLALSPSSASSSAPLKVPAGDSVSLPAPGASAPSIALRDLPINQDACQGVQFPLVFSGKAHG